jgi:hypothetical protein
MVGGQAWADLLLLGGAGEIYPFQRYVLKKMRPAGSGARISEMPVPRQPAGPMIVSKMIVFKMIVVNRAMLVRGVLDQMQMGPMVAVMMVKERDRSGARRAGVEKHPAMMGRPEDGLPAPGSGDHFHLRAVRRVLVAAACGLVPRLIQVHPVQMLRVGAGNFALHVFRHAGEVALDHVQRMRPGGVAMRKI